MSRGLSQQQQQILGLAAHVNRITQGDACVVKTGAPMANYRCPTVDYPGVKDLQWPLPAHLLHALPFVDAATRIEKSNGVVQSAGSFFDLRTPQAKSAKASILRAIQSLVRDGFLIMAPHDALFRWGYVLTDRGIALGSQREMLCAPALLWRAGLIVFPTEYQFCFYQIYARLVTEVLSLSQVIAAFQLLTPCPVEGPMRTGTPEYEQYWRWHRLHREQQRTMVATLLGDEQAQRMYGAGALRA